MIDSLFCVLAILAASAATTLGVELLEPRYTPHACMALVALCLALSMIEGMRGGVSDD